MGRAIDRLPADFEEPRTPPRKQPRQSDIHNDAHHTLLAPMPEGLRAERDEAARRYLRRKGAEDLIEVLGLGEAKRPATPLDIVCPTCQTPARRRCVSKAGNEIGHLHVGRVRGAQHAEAVEQLVDKILTEA